MSWFCSKLYRNLRLQGTSRKKHGSPLHDGNRGTGPEEETQRNHRRINPKTWRAHDESSSARQGVTPCCSASLTSDEYLCCLRRWLHNTKAQRNVPQKKDTKVLESKLCVFKSGVAHFMSLCSIITIRDFSQKTTSVIMTPFLCPESLVKGCLCRCRWREGEVAVVNIAALAIFFCVGCGCIRNKSVTLCTETIWQSAFRLLHESDNTQKEIKLWELL